MYSVLLRLLKRQAFNRMLCCRFGPVMWVPIPLILVPMLLGIMMFMNDGKDWLARHPEYVRLYGSQTTLAEYALVGGLVGLVVGLLLVGIWKCGELLVGLYDKQEE